MNKEELYTLIDLTIEIGNQLIHTDFHETEFEKYQQNLNIIIENGFKLYTSKSQLKTCQIIGSLSPFSFRLSLIQQLFFAGGKKSKWKVNCKNTEEQMIKRYILNINEHLPILNADSQLNSFKLH